MLHCTVKEMRQRMDQAEFLGWAAYRTWQNEERQKEERKSSRSAKRRGH